MFNSPLPTAVTEPKGTINLCARVSIAGINLEVIILEASAETQSCRVQIPGRGQAIVAFSSIQNVSLKYADGTVLQSFGAPRASNPASLEYIQYAEVQS
jgi:hypothetical protein